MPQQDIHEDATGVSKKHRQHTRKTPNAPTKSNTLIFSQFIADTHITRNFIKIIRNLRVGMPQQDIHEDATG
jgi:hypothetical protein